MENAPIKAINYFMAQIVDDTQNIKNGAIVPVARYSDGTYMLWSCYSGIFLDRESIRILDFPSLYCPLFVG